MPIFDTPITTNDASLDKVLGQDLPVVLVLHRGKLDAALDRTLQAAAKEHSGALLFARVDVNDGPQSYDRFGCPQLPAVVTLDEGAVESRAGNVRVDDVEAHIDFLLGMGPMPTETAAETEAKAASGAAPVHTSDQTFAADVLQSDVPVLVDFWAPWCGPCLMVAPVLDRLAEQYAGRIKIAKLNVDNNRQTAMTYRTMSIPTMILFKNGEPIGQLVGAQPQPNIEQFMKQAL